MARFLDWTRFIFKRASSIVSSSGSSLIFPKLYSFLDLDIYLETLFLSFPKFNNLIFELELVSRIKIIWLPRKIFGID